MFESTAEHIPSDYLHIRAAEFLHEQGLDDVTEVTLKSSDGGVYWMRRLDGCVQSILCRLPIEDHFERRVQVHWSIAPDDEGVIQLVETLYAAQYHPADPRAHYTVQQPIGVSEEIVDDLFDALLADAEVVESDSPTGERVAYRALAIRAFMARIAATNADIGTVSTGVFVWAT